MLTYEPVWTGAIHTPHRGYLSAVECAHAPKTPPKAVVYHPARRQADGDRAQVGRAMQAYFEAHPGSELAAHEITTLVPHVPMQSLSSALAYMAKQKRFARRQTWRQVTGGLNRLVWVYRSVEAA